MTAQKILSVTDYMDLPAVPATVRLPYGVDPAQFGDLYLPAQTEKGENHPLMVLVHGGCWRAQYGLAQLGRFCKTFAQLGIAVWSVEYRRLDNGGGWPTTFLDVAKGIDYVRTIASQYALDLRRVVAVGHSAGGHLALWLAARHRLPVDSPLFLADPLPLTGVVALAGIPDLVDAAQRNICGDAVPALLGGSAQDFPTRYATASPQALLPLGVSQHLIIGMMDEAVSVAHNEAYIAAARAQGDAVAFTLLSDVGHFELVTPGTAAWTTVQDAVLSFF